ncbi:MAG: flagellar biosynthesis anti-sigma factor FlgM [Sarcina sp.]
MRINSLNSSDGIAKIYEKKSENKNNENKIKSSVLDKIELSVEAKKLQKVDIPIIDEAEKIKKIKELIKNENYEVDSKKLAKAMLNRFKNMGE